MYHYIKKKMVHWYYFDNHFIRIFTTISKLDPTLFAEILVLPRI